MIGAYYNEWEWYPAQWIRNLAAAGHVADGTVDERSIRDVRATDLVGRAQCHFFAGLGGWSYALRLAGWGDDRAVWTASCPCQPFSTAGKQCGFADDRHLWPVLFELVRECRPAILFGEQVAGPAGRAWLDAVSADLESAGYAVGSANLCAAGVGAPHIRQRLYFVALADADHAGPQGWRERRDGSDERTAREGGVAGELADADGQRLDGKPVQLRGRGQVEAGSQAPRRGDAGELADADGHGRGPRRTSEKNGDGAIESSRRRAPERLGDTDRMRAGWVTGGRNGAEAAGDRARGVDGHGGHDADAPGAWSDVEWIACTDGKSRPTKPGVHPLAHGVPARVGKLRAGGNAIVPQVAAAWVGAVMDELGVVPS